MAKTLSTAHQTELDKTITSVGYLLQINTSPLLRWCNIGDVTWDTFPWVDFDFSVDGLKYDSEKELECTINAQNLDNTIAALFLSSHMDDVSVELYQFTRGALAFADIIKLGNFSIDGCDITLDRLSLKLVSTNSLFSFTPRRRIDPYYGFNYALPSGTQIIWENDIIIVEAEDG